ncbi:LytTR family DNA-binding domain-containing protein [Listeria sp. PSOL-1]|uniref:LytR/AlgR family response regulator transcription factor n=1 Tax=Listeria sp. PSOL-1 TaxID=1844999 RepID=UPI0013D4BEF7|nr:LytTR family transcriptional regulator DNA-binding domain-containing protein [Listeria sp. PSOL-1]
MNLYILEDNFLHREYLEKHVQLILEKKARIDYDVIGVKDLFAFYQNVSDDINDDDVFIVDIDFNTNFNGIELAKKIRKNNLKCFIVFCTSNTQNVLQIINEQILPINYLVKNVGSTLSLHDQLEETLTQIIDITTRRTNEAEHYQFRWGGNILNILLSDINYIKTLKGQKNSVIVTISSQYIIGKTLKEIKQELQENNQLFYLDLNSYIINILNIKEINRIERKVVFYSGEEIELGIRIIDKIRNFIGD